MAIRVQIRIRERGGALVVSVGHKLMDADVCAALRKVVLDATGVRRLPVVLDLAKVSLLPSLAIGQLLTLRKELVARGGGLVLACATKSVRRVLSVTRLDEVLSVADTVQLGVVMATADGQGKGPAWAAVAPRHIWIKGKPGT